MIYIFFSLIFFVVTVMVQIIVHKILLVYGKRTFATIHVLTLGCFVHALLQYLLFQSNSQSSLNENLWLLPLPWSASFLYVLLFFFYITYSASPYLGQEGPTSKILNLFRRHPYLTEQQIFKSFTDQETVLARIDDLMKSGWVTKDRGYLKLNSFGKVLARFILFYRNILGLHIGG